MAKILIVEDNQSIREAAAEYMKLAGHDLVEAGTVKKAEELLKRKMPDLVVLDVMLPDGNGFLLAKKIRQEMKAGVPIIFLTAKTQEADRITGFELGADDYVIKPFSPKELSMRVAAVLARVAPARAGGQAPATSPGPAQKEGPAVRSWKLGNQALSIDNLAHRVYSGGREIELTGAEWKILDYLSGHSGIVVSRDQLLENSLDYDVPVSERTIDTHVKNLRAKLGEAGWIQTIRGFGYRFSGKKS